MWELSGHSGNALLLLLAVADFADDNGVAWPGHERLSEKTRVSRRHVIRMVDETTKTGELWAMNRGHQQSNVYIVTPGLNLEELVKGVRKARDLGVKNTRGSDSLSLPPQVLVVVTGCPYQEAEKQASRDIVTLGGDIYVPTLGTPVSPDPSLPVINRQGEDLWKTVLDELAMQVDKDTFDTWLKTSKLITDDNGTWTVQLTNQAAVDWAGNRLRRALGQALQRHAPGIEVEFVA